MNRLGAPPSQPCSESRLSRIFLIRADNGPNPGPTGYVAQTSPSPFWFSGLIYQTRVNDDPSVKLKSLE